MLLQPRGGQVANWQRGYFEVRVLDCGRGRRSATHSAEPNVPSQHLIKAH